MTDPKVGLGGSVPRRDALHRRDARKLAYSQVVASYEAITEFRGKLLALLPLVTATGASWLLRQKTAQLRELLGPIGLLGLVVTVGLFFYELRGMQRCHRLEVQAATLEERLGLSREEGPFMGAPPRPLMNMGGPPAAGLIIYLATAFTWIYIAGSGFLRRAAVPQAWWLLLVYPVVLGSAWLLLSRWLDEAATGNRKLDPANRREGSRADAKRSERPSRVDEAALGSATVAAVVALAFGPGAYGWLNSGVGAALALLLSAYYRPALNPPGISRDANTRALAFGAVAGLLVAMILAWPIQWGLCRAGHCYRETEPNPADLWIACIWVVAGLVLAAVHRRRVPPCSDRPLADQAESDHGIHPAR